MLRWRPLALVLLLVSGLHAASPDAATATAPEAADDDGATVLVPWTNGTFLVGAGGIGVAAPAEGAPGLNMRTWHLVAPGCDRRLFLDLSFAPTNLTGVPDPLVEVDYSFLATIQQSEERVDRPVVREVRDLFLGELPAEGPFVFSLRLRQGADVEWSMRLTARESLSGDGCGPPPLVAILFTELEANPEGIDAGNEWLELFNLGSTAVDLAGWTVSTTHGTTVNVTLDANATIPGGGYLLVTHHAQWLDNDDEAVVLFDAAGNEHDRTPILSDRADDARSWQRDDGVWVFATASPLGPAP